MKGLLMKRSGVNPDETHRKVGEYSVATKVRVCTIHPHQGRDVAQELSAVMVVAVVAVVEEENPAV
jgi:hypothetical protein